MRIIPMQSKMNIQKTDNTDYNQVKKSAAQVNKQIGILNTKLSLLFKETQMLMFWYSISVVLLT